MRERIAAGLFTLLVLASVATTAFATSQRTFVSVFGSDANPCNPAAPCRTFATALVNTTSGGEIIVADTGGYGTVVIDKPVSITAPSGIYAGVTVFSGSGIVVNPGSGAVNLTGLTINAVGGAIGIEFLSGATLRLANMIVSGFSDRGLKAYLSASGVVEMRDSTFREIGAFALDLKASTGTLSILIDRTQLLDNHYALNLTDNVAGTVSDTVIRGSIAGVGYVQAVNAGAATNVSFVRCTISDNSIGIWFGFPGGTTTIQVTDSEFSNHFGSAAVHTETNGTAYFSRTTITRNAVAIDTNLGGQAISFGDNLVYANGGGEVFSSTLGKK